MLDSLLSLLALAAMVLAAGALGRPFVRALCPGRHDALSATVWALALGLVAVGMLLVALGLLGLLYRPLIGVLTTVGAMWGAIEYAKSYRRGGLPAWRPEDDDGVFDADGTRRGGWVATGLVLLTGLVIVGTLIAALAPPTAGDALCYHLELPKYFLAEHALAYSPYQENGTFPLLAEMWFLWALALEGGVAAQLTHWLSGLLLAGAGVLLARPVLGPRWSLAVAPVVLLVPGISNGMTAPLNDVALAAFTTLSLAAWRLGLEDSTYRRWFVAAGIMAGAALGVKYSALLVAVAATVPWLWQLARRPGRRRELLVGAATVACLAASIGGVWYVRALWHRGNPVYPFFSQHIGMTGPEAPPGLKKPLGSGPLDALWAPWHVTMQPEGLGGRGHELGPLFLALLPGLFFVRRLRGLGWLLIVATVYALLWFVLRQNVRFLYPLVPPLAVGIVWLWLELQRLPTVPRRLLFGASLVCLVLGALFPVVRARDKLAVAVGIESREEYLMRSEPTYPAAMVSNLVTSPEAHLLSQDYRGFYFNCRVTRESVYRRLTAYDRDVSSTSDLSRNLRQRGFTHLLLAETDGSAGLRFDATLSRLVAQHADGETDGFARLAHYQFRDSDGALRRYQLFLLR